MDHHSVYNNTHAKLLAFDLIDSTRWGPLSRAEAVGTVVSRELKPDKFLKFTLDDGTGCIPCVLWLNHATSPHFARVARSQTDVGLIAEAALRSADSAVVGTLVRVRGRVTRYMGQTQITVSDVVAERDPNAEVLHWLDCLWLARRRYGVEARKSK